MKRRRPGSAAIKEEDEYEAYQFPDGSGGGIRKRKKQQHAGGDDGGNGGRDGGDSSSDGSHSCGGGGDGVDLTRQRRPKRACVAIDGDDEE